MSDTFSCFSGWRQCRLCSINYAYFLIMNIIHMDLRQNGACDRPRGENQGCLGIAQGRFSVRRFRNQGGQFSGRNCGKCRGVSSRCRGTGGIYRVKTSSAEPPLNKGPTKRVGDALRSLARPPFPSTRRVPTRGWLQFGASFMWTFQIA
jgi:hypothetical protein